MTDTDLSEWNFSHSIKRGVIDDAKENPESNWSCCGGWLARRRTNDIVVYKVAEVVEL